MTMALITLVNKYSIVYVSNQFSSGRHFDSYWITRDTNNRFRWTKCNSHTVNLPWCYKNEFIDSKPTPGVKAKSRLQQNCQKKTEKQPDITMAWNYFFYYVRTKTIFMSTNTWNHGCFFFILELLWFYADI